MLNYFWTRIRFKGALVLVITHLGLGLGIAGVLKGPASGLLIAGLACLYGGFALGAGFLALPVLRVRRFVRLLRTYKDAWNAGKRAAAQMR